MSQPEPRTPTAPTPRQVYVECPPAWGPGRILIGELETLGYKVADRRTIGTGERRLLLS